MGEYIFFKFSCYVRKWSTTNSSVIISIVKYLHRLENSSDGFVRDSYISSRCLHQKKLAVMVHIGNVHSSHFMVENFFFWKSYDKPVEQFS